MLTGYRRIFILPGSEELSRNHAASAGNAVEQGEEKEGDRSGRAHGRQGIGSQHPAHNHGIRQIIGLLEDIADQQGESKDGKQNQRFALRHVHSGCSEHKIPPPVSAIPEIQIAAG